MKNTFCKIYLFNINNIFLGIKYNEINQQFDYNLIYIYHIFFIHKMMNLTQFRFNRFIYASSIKHAIKI